MSLSAATLKLKFMQRATAKPTSTTTTTVNNADSAFHTTEITNIRPAPPTPDLTSGIGHVEDGLRWSVPAPPSASRTHLTRNEGVTVRFESSYLPFLNGEMEPRGSSSRGGGGRIR